MSFQTFVTQRLAAITQMINAINTNAKKIDELPAQETLNLNSKIHVSRDGNSESLELQKIIDQVSAISSQYLNELISIGEFTLVGNTLTIPTANWRINNINYFISTPAIFNIAYAQTGKSRIDILLANNLGQIIKVAGFETTGIALRPNIPVNTILVSEITVTDSLFEIIPSSQLSNDELDAVQGSNTPSASNPFATMDDITNGTVQSVTGTLVNNTDTANPVIDTPTLQKVFDVEPNGVYATLELGDVVIDLIVGGSTTELNTDFGYAIEIRKGDNRSIREHGYNNIRDVLRTKQDGYVFESIDVSENFNDQNFNTLIKILSVLDTATQGTGQIRYYHPTPLLGVNAHIYFKNPPASGNYHIPFQEDIDLDLSNKVDKDPNKGLSSNDFSDEDKLKLDNLTTYTGFRGTQSSLVNVISAYPDGAIGNWAIISNPSGPAYFAVWDNDATPAQWVDAGQSPTIPGTNLSYTIFGNTLTIVSDTGSDVTIPLATTTSAGLQSKEDKSKLDNIASNATANSSDAVLKDRDNHTGTQLANTISDFATAVANLISDASISAKGIMKLYTTTGANTDGTMTQKAITDLQTAKEQYKLVKVVDSSGLTGTTAEAQVDVFTIPAGKFTTNDVLKIKMSPRHVGVGGNWQFFIRIGQTNVYSSSTLLATQSVQSSGNLSGSDMERYVGIRGATNLDVFNATVGAQFENGSGLGNSRTNITTVDVTQQFCIFVGCKNGSAVDTSYIAQTIIERLRST